jgi:exosome complex component RRP4
MTKILVKEKSIVVPGEILAIGMDYLPSRGTFREKENIISSIVGTFKLDARLIKVIPLNGKYEPKRNDMVIGKVVNIGHNGWMVDIGYPFNVGISLKEGSRDFIPNSANLKDYYDIGDLIVGKVIQIRNPKIIDISMTFPGCRKLIGGRIIKVESSRVPRIIGREGSMVKMLKEETGCEIKIGQNGLVWISGPDPKSEYRAAIAIKKINNEATTEGLTDIIKKFLGDNK